MRVSDAEEQLRAAVRERVKAAEEGRPDDICRSADSLVELAIGRLTLAALFVGRVHREEGSA